MAASRGLHRRQRSLLTIDLGHQSGQHRYRRPPRKKLLTALEHFRTTGQPPEFWVGPDPVLESLRAAARADGKQRDIRLQEIEDTLAQYPHFYAEESDGDPYRWLRELAGWSPIIHLQQTDGKTSAHRPFNAKTNRAGIIEGARVLEAIRDHDSSADEDGTLPLRVTDIYLTLEVFAGTVETPEQIRKNCANRRSTGGPLSPSTGIKVDSLLK